MLAAHPSRWFFTSSRSTRAALASSGRSCFELLGEVVGQLDRQLALGHVAVVVGNVERQVGEHLVAVHVLHQLHHGVEHGAQHRLVQLRAFAHLGSAELDCALEPRVVGFLAGHERLEVANLERLGEVLVVVERLGAAGFHVEHLEIEALGAGELVPVAFGDALRHEALVGGVHGERDQAVHEGGLALHPRADRLGGHVAAVDDGVAGEHAQRRGVARHLDVGVLEDVLVAVEALGFLVEAGQRLHLRFDLFLDLPGEIVARGLVRALALAADEQHGAFHVAALRARRCRSR